MPQITVIRSFCTHKAYVYNGTPLEAFRYVHNKPDATPDDLDKAVTDGMVAYVVHTEPATEVGEIMVGL